MLFHFLLARRRGLLQFRRARSDRFQLGGNAALAGAEGFKQNVVLLFLTRALENLVLRTALLPACDIQLVLRGSQLALGLVRLALRGGKLFRQRPLFFRQLL